MNKDIKQIIKNWYISYDPYSDLFQIYDDVVFKLSKNETEEKKAKNFRAILSKETSEPVLFEVKKAYDTFGVDIDNLSKPAIIKLIEPYLAKYA